MHLLLRIILPTSDRQHLEYNGFWSYRLHFGSDLCGGVTDNEPEPQFNFIAIGIAAVFGMIALLFVNDKHADYQTAHESEINNTEIVQSL